MGVLKIKTGRPFLDHEPIVFSQFVYDRTRNETTYFDYEDQFVITALPPLSAGDWDVAALDEFGGPPFRWTLRSQPKPVPVHIPPFTAENRLIYRFLVRPGRVPVKPPPSKAPKKKPFVPIVDPFGGVFGSDTGFREGGLFEAPGNPFGSLLAGFFPQGVGPLGDGPGISGMFGPGGGPVGGVGAQLVDYTPGVGGGGGGGSATGSGSISPSDVRPSYEVGSGFGMDYDSGSGEEVPLPTGLSWNPGRGSADVGSFDSPSSPGSSSSAAEQAGTAAGEIASKAVKGGYVDPTRNPSGFTRDPFFDRMTMRALRDQGAFIAAPSGPVQALRPDMESGGPGVTTVAIQQGIVDPISPVAGGEHYEPRTYGPRRVAGAAPDIGRPGMEALYPDDSEQDSSNSTVALVTKLIADRPGGPKEPGGDPYALGIGGRTIVAVSTGVLGGTRSA